VNCGKIVCEAEGEGPCLFCGNWVDRENTYDLAALGGDANLAL
jgi:activating signal cointegrator 1